MFKKNRPVTKVTLILRLVVSAYLIYLGVSLFEPMLTATGNEKIIFSVVVVVFCLVGVVFGGSSLMRLIKEDYDKGDTGEDD